MPSGAASVLHKPLQYEALIDALVAVEQRVAPRPAAVASRVLAAGCCFRLRQWPPADLLRGDHERVRLATFLSARSLDIDQLARLSNVGLETCLDFVTRMARQDLLSIEFATAPRQAASARSGRSSRRSATPRPPGMFERLRRHLGI